jgi:hypothetical protein
VMAACEQVERDAAAVVRAPTDAAADLNEATRLIDEQVAGLNAEAVRVQLLHAIESDE